MAIVAVEYDGVGRYAGVTVYTEPWSEAPAMEAEFFGTDAFEEDLGAAWGYVDGIGEEFVAEASQETPEALAGTETGSEG